MQKKNIIATIGLSLLGVHREMGGNFQYAMNLVKDLSRCLENKYRLIAFLDNGELISGVLGQAPCAEIVYVDHQESSNVFKRLVRLAVGISGSKFKPSWLRGRYILLDDYRCDAIFYPYWHTAAFITRSPSVVAIHDCAPRENPELFKLGARLRLDYLIKSIAKHATLIMADSNYGKNLIVKHYHRDAKSIFVFPFKPPAYFNLSGAEASILPSYILGKYRLPSSYLFLPGRWGSYKNTERVLEALAIIIGQGKNVPNLVLTGIRDSEIPIASKFIEGMGLTQYVHLLGFVPDIDMGPLYANALALIFPTLLGPTSIPVYEAMAFGCPVIVSNVSGYPELVGAAGLLVDPYNVGSIAEAILLLTENSSLREKFCVASLKRFSELAAVDHAVILKEMVLRVTEQAEHFQ